MAQPTGPGLRVIGLSVVHQKAYYILAVPVKSCSHLAAHEGRADEGEPVPFCLIRVLSANTISDTTGWRVFSEVQDPTEVNTDFMEFAASQPAATPADHMLELLKRTDPKAYRKFASRITPSLSGVRIQCLSRRTQTHTPT